MAPLFLAQEQQTGQLKRLHHEESHVGKFCPHCHHNQPDGHQKGGEWKTRKLKAETDTDGGNGNTIDC